MEPFKTVNGDLPLGHVENHTVHVYLMQQSRHGIIFLLLQHASHIPGQKATTVFLASNKFSISLDLQYQTVYNNIYRTTFNNHNLVV